MTTYTPLTVGRAPTTVTFTVTGTPAAAGFTVRGYGGALIPTDPNAVDFALLTETGAYLTTEAGDLLLTA